MLGVQTGEGANREIALTSQPTADFYQSLMRVLRELDLPIAIDRYPNELPDRTPFDRDREHGVYNPEQAHRFWQVLLCVEPVFQRFRTGWLGKVSPVHLFWGSFDLAVTRFSGRAAPKHPGGNSEPARRGYSRSLFP